MDLARTSRTLYNAVSWHVRGLWASEDNRELTFAARELWQPAEIEARRGLARELSTELLPELRIDRNAAFLRLPPSALPDLERVSSIGRAIINASTADDGATPNKKPFFRYRIASEDERLEIMKLGMDRRLLAMAATYLGVLPVITEVDYYCSFPAGLPWTKSQLWHCDDDARTVFKIFIYCDDVTEDDGPFELIPPAASRRARDGVGYRYAGRRYRVSDDAMARYVPASEITTVTGPKQTAFACDTVHCFHRGSRIVDANRRRVMAMICYTPPTALTLPRRLASGGAPMQGFESHFTDELGRAVLGGPIARKWI
jgi:hypothetical protein